MAVHSVQSSEQEHCHVIHPLLDRHNDLYIRHKPHLLSLGCGGSQGGPQTHRVSVEGAHYNPTECSLSIPLPDVLVSVKLS